MTPLQPQTPVLLCGTVEDENRKPIAGVGVTKRSGNQTERASTPVEVAVTHHEYEMRSQVVVALPKEIVGKIAADYEGPLGLRFGP